MVCFAAQIGRVAHALHIANCSVGQFMPVIHVQPLLSYIQMRYSSQHLAGWRYRLREAGHLVETASMPFTRSLNLSCVLSSHTFPL